MSNRPLIRIPSTFQVVFALTIVASTLATVYLTWSRAAVRSLTLRPGQEWESGGFDQIRLSDGADNQKWITGVTQQEEHFRVVRWPSGAAFPAGDWLLPFPAKPFAWTLSANGQWLHAIVHDKLLSYDLLHNGALKTSPLAPAPVQALTTASDSQALVLYKNRTYEVWDADLGKQAFNGKLDTQPDDVVRAESGALLLEHRSAGQTEVFKFDSGRPSTAIQIEGKTHVSLPSSGSPTSGLVLDSGKGIRWQGVDLPLPGPASHVLLGEDGWLFAAGDFDDLYAVAPAAEPIEFNFGFRPKTMLIAKDQLYAGTDQDLFVFQIRQSSALRTNPGWALILCGSISTLGGLYILSLFLEMYSRMLLRFWDRKKPRQIFEAPVPPAPVPEELVSAFRRNEVVLWAGSGLMAQTDYPARTQMVGQLLDVARRDQWANQSWLSTADRQAKLGDTERAVGALVRSSDGARKLVEEFTRRIYSQWTVIVTAKRHLISQLPLAGAITTNYGRVLEDLNSKWASNACDIGSLDIEHFFFLKLYGDVSPEDGILLSREELALELRTNPTAIAQLRSIAETRTMLFLGCSADALLRDLDLLSMPRPRHSHYALVAVKNSNWQQIARDLLRDHGVKVIPVAEDKIAQVLPIWVGRVLSSLQSPAAEGQSSDKIHLQSNVF